MDKMKRKVYIFTVVVACVFTFTIVEIVKNKETVLTSSVRYYSFK